MPRPFVAGGLGQGAVRGTARAARQVAACRCAGAVGAAGRQASGRGPFRAMRSAAGGRMSAAPRLPRPGGLAQQSGGDLGAPPAQLASRCPRPPARARCGGGTLAAGSGGAAPRDPGSVHGIDGRPEGGIGAAAAARRPLNFPAEGAGDALLYGPSFLPFFLVLFIVWGEGVGLGRHWQGPKATALFCFVLCRIAGLASFCFVAVSPRSPAVLDGKPKCIYSQFEGPRA